MALVGSSSSRVVAIGEGLNESVKFGNPTRIIHAVLTEIKSLGAGQRLIIQPPSDCFFRSEA